MFFGVLCFFAFFFLAFMIFFVFFWNLRVSGFQGSGFRVRV